MKQKYEKDLEPNSNEKSSSVASHSSTAGNSIQHTPGPWEYKKWQYSPVDDFIIQNKDENNKQPLTYVGTVRKRIKDGEAEANANLIAAAPELLEALQLVWKDSINNDNDCQITVGTAMKVLDAIKKAKGGTL
jgi:hypothetical protein